MKAKINIVFSFFLRGLSICINFLLVPLTLNYLNPVKYGIWLTLSSIILWMGFFDIGLGNGLRNKLAEAIAKNDLKLAKGYVSTTYAIITVLMAVVYILFSVINPFINWINILKAPIQYANEINQLVYIVFSFFCLQFILKILTTVLIANQLSAYSDLFNFLTNFISIILIWLLTKYTSSSLIYLGLVLSLTPILVLIIASFSLYYSRFREYVPSFKCINTKYIRDLAGLGFKFFFLQISWLVIYTTDNMIITQLFGPAQVTSYNIAYKYFSILTMVFTILITPYWTGFTDAYFKNDMVWIKQTMETIMKIAISLILISILMICFSNFAYSVWLGKSFIHIPFILSVFMGIFVIINAWIIPYTYFVNGVGKVKLQVYLSSFSMIIHIPLSIFFAKYLNLGISGVIIGTIISLLPLVIFMPMQYNKI